MKKYLIIWVVSMMATVAMAQTLTPQQEQEFFHKAYVVINTYSKSPDFSDDRSRSQFIALFENEEVTVFNDLMGLNYEPTLSVKKYVSLLETKARDVEVSLKNVQKEKVWIEDGIWFMSITFDKGLAFTNECDTHFDSRNFFGEYYRLKMTLVMNGEGSKCCIRDLCIDGDMEPFPQEYRVLHALDRYKRDKELFIIGKGKVFFAEGQKVLSPSEQLSYRGSRVLEKETETTSCGDKWVYADYEDKSWRLRGGGAFAISDFNRLKNSEGFTFLSNGETAFNLEIGYVSRLSNRLLLGVFAGGGISRNRFSMNYTPTKEELMYDASNNGLAADLDGEGYKRMYEGIAGIGDDGKGIMLTQNMDAMDFTVPIYLDLEYEFNAKLSLYADLGLKLQTSTGVMSATISDYETWGEYSTETYGDLVIRRDEYKNNDGYKEKYVGEYLDKEYMLNNFGFHSAGTIDVEEEGVSKSMTIDGLLGLGMRLNLNKSLAIDAGVQYQVGGESWKANAAESIFGYTLEGGDKVNLLRKAGSIHHNALKVAASVIYKF